MSAPNPYLDAYTNDYDLLSMPGGLKARHSASSIDRPKSLQRLKKRIYRKIPLSPELTAVQFHDPPNDLRLSRRTQYNMGYSSEFLTIPLASHPLTPPQSFSSHTESNSYSSAKRRKPNCESNPQTCSTDDKRHELVVQMQLLRTSLEDEEALVWSSSEDESGDDLRCEHGPVITGQLRRLRS